MTRREMSELYSVMLLAWPGAPAFKGGEDRLAPAIELWAAAMEDVPFALGKRAMMACVRELRYPPTVAEVREMAERIAADDKEQADEAWSRLCTLLDLEHGDRAAALRRADPGILAAVSATGGPDKVTYYSFCRAWQAQGAAQLPEKKDK